MDPLRIALLQALPAGWDQEANLAKGEQLCRRAHEMGADLALFPEMWNVGYQFFDSSKDRSRKEWLAQVVGADSSYVHRFQETARNLNIAIAITYLEEWDDAPRNSISLIDRNGEIQMIYAKVHPCEFDKEAALTPGDGFHVCNLDTRIGEIRVGAMICYDREFPESARVLMLQGAEIILTPNACTLEQHRLGQFKARAFENMVGLAMTNYPAPHCNGHSIAVDPVVFSKDEESLDIVLVEAGEEEGVFVADFDMKALRRYREREVWGNAYRKPGVYGKLTSSDVRAPFLRHNSKR